MSKSVEPLILSLETATRAGSIALARGHQLIAARAGDAKVSHSTNLLSDVDALLRETGCGLREVGLFAAACGPGSFTGLRIGLATVKSLAATLERRCAGVPTLEAVAYAAGPSRGTVAMIPAGRGEVFAQVFRIEPEGVVQMLGPPVHQPPRRLIESVRHLRRLRWAGEGAWLHASEIEAAASDNALEFRTRSDLERGQAAAGACGLSEAATGIALEDLQDVWTLSSPKELMAATVAVLAAHGYTREETLSPDELRAIYVRPSDAELHEHAQNILRDAG